MEIKLTPKEKAIQLVDKFNINVDMFTNIDNEDYIASGLLSTKSRIKLALIEVNEIIDLDDFSVEGRQYYQEIKEEIEKLKKNK